MPVGTHARRSSGNPTLIPPPPPSGHLSPVETTLALTQLDEVAPNIFTNTYALWQPLGARGIYGGCVIAQSLLAAQRTVPAEYAPHSMHCYFVLAGNPNTPIMYHVDIVRKGRSFHTRTVQARQKGRCIFTTTVSFTLPAPEEDVSGNGKRIVRHQNEMPNVPTPEDCESELEYIERLIREGKATPEAAIDAKARADQDPFEWKRIGMHPDNEAETPPSSKIFRSWVRSRAKLHDDTFHCGALAYFSDSWFIGTVRRVNNKARGSDIGMMVSLDHTIYFHYGARTSVDDGWLLVENESPWAGEERGLVRQRIWDQDGGLVASCVQEGLVRLKDGREGEASKL